MSYATLDDAKRELKTDDSAASTVTVTAAESFLKSAVETVTTRIKRMGFYFEPVYEAREIELLPEYVDSTRNTLRLDRALLELSAVSVNGVSVTVNTQVKPYPTNKRPIRDLYLADGYTWWYSVSDDDDPPVLTVTGYWGYHDSYSTAWQKEDDVLNAAGITASATSITVADADGANVYGITPRFSYGNLIKVDTEYMRVTGTNTSTNALTVRRGENGTTAASHALNADIYVFYPEEDIKREVARQAGLMYARRGAYQQTTITDVGVTTYPADLLTALYDVLQNYVDLM